MNTSTTFTIENGKDYRYRPYYCEENIWHLCQHADCTDSTVVFIASRGDLFPMLCQKAMADPATPLLWDYHVILLIGECRKSRASTPLSPRVVPPNCALSGVEGQDECAETSCTTPSIDGSTPCILDFDTTLPFCSDLQTFLTQSFLDESTLAQAYVPYFRLIPAADFIKQFRSDRSHMKTASGWSAPPPSWPTIGAGGSNLAAFTDMQDHSIGEVLSRTELLTRYLAI